MIPDNVEDSDTLSLQFSAKLTRVDQVCHDVLGRIKLWNLENHWFKIHLILREVLNNAVIHGCSQNESLQVGLELKRKPGILVLRVWDEGPGFDWKGTLLRPVMTDEDNGRGMPIFSAYARDFSFNTIGNEITLNIETTQEENKMEITKRQDWTVVSPQKDVVSSAATELRKELKKLADSGVKKIEIDMKNVEMMDSMGLGLLIALHNTLKDQGGMIRVVNLSAELMELFKNMRLDRHFEVIEG